MKISRKITLYLEEEEAEWLKQIMQNPLFGETPDTEDAVDMVIREKFWIALSSKAV